MKATTTTSQNGEGLQYAGAEQGADGHSSASQVGRLTNRLVRFRELNEQQAKLLSASAEIADEMLNALKSAEEWMAVEARTSNGTVFHRDLAMIRAAIAKAEGR